MTAELNDALLSRTLTLPAILDLKAAAPLAERLLAARGSTLTLDASAVERMGGQCLQVLLSAVSTWKADGASLSIAEPSAGFTAGLSLLGLTEDELMTKELQA